jgi:hypothetical protein
VPRLLAIAAAGVAALALGVAAAATDPAIVTVYPVANARGVMATSGGWAYCLQLQKLAKRSGYTLVCGKYFKDGYTGFGLRSERRLDWGEPRYLASLAAKIRALHARVGGELVLAGVSYSGFGVATLASHHPELRPDRVIVIDSYLDLVARRSALKPTARIAREIDAQTVGSAAVLRAQTVDVEGLAQLVRGGTSLTVVWSVSPEEQREFAGATCDENASARVLARLAAVLHAPVDAWVTHSPHGHDLWDSGRRIVAGNPPGQKVTFRPGARIPSWAVCR